MAELTDIRALYEDYIAEVTSLERNRKPGEGIFGLRGGPADNPCHDRFAADLEQLLGEFTDAAPSPAEVRQLLEYMYTVPPAHREPRGAYWMLLAVHKLSLPLIPALTPQDAAALRTLYAKTYPRWERLPVQESLLSALKERMKG